MSMNNRYFLSLKISFDVCNQFGLSFLWHTENESECVACFQKTGLFASWEQMKARKQA